VSEREPYTRLEAPVGNTKPNAKKKDEKNEDGDGAARQYSAVAIFASGSSRTTLRPLCGPQDEKFGRFLDDGRYGQGA
jgi:hypothetical protein